MWAWRWLTATKGISRATQRALAADKSHQQRAGQARRVGHGHGVDLLERQAGLAQGLVDHRQDALEMGAGGDFRHHAAEAPVQVVLRGHDRGQHLQPVGHDRRGRFVAGGFEREDVHGALASSRG